MSCKIFWGCFVIEGFETPEHAEKFLDENMVPAFNEFVAKKCEESKLIWKEIDRGQKTPNNPA